MKITVRIIRDNKKHVHLAVFVNGAATGRLCMRTEEAKVFVGALQESFASIELSIIGEFTK